MLPDLADALGGAYEVLVDGGVRRPADVVKAISLGARAVLLGRPILWALGAGGEDGVVDLLEWFTLELRRSMALVGADSIEAIDGSLAKFTL